MIGNIHDIESYTYLDNQFNFNPILYTSHWSHLTVIFCWLVSFTFHIGYQGNFEFWISNPIKIIPIAHSIFDPHMNSYDPESDAAFSGLYNLYATIGYINTLEIYKFILIFQCLALIFSLFALVHSIYIDSLVMFTPLRIEIFSL